MSSSSEELIFLSLYKSRHQDTPDGGFLIVVRCAGHFPKHGICRHLNLAMYDLQAHLACSIKWRCLLLRANTAFRFFNSTKNTAEKLQKSKHIRQAFRKRSPSPIFFRSYCHSFSTLNSSMVLVSSKAPSFLFDRTVKILPSAG